jgi:hypothetical protein
MKIRIEFDGDNPVEACRASERALTLAIAATIESWIGFGPDEDEIKANLQKALDNVRAVRERACTQIRSPKVYVA